MDVATTAATNPDQVAAWDGDEGAFWAAHPDQFEAVLEHYEPAFRDACGVQPHHRVLDIGCGNGGTTRAAARRASDGFVLGIDLSARMLEVAERLANAEGLTNVRFEQADAQVHPFAEGGFDLVMSRTGAMFFGRPVEAFANLRRALRPGGRLALLTWQPIDTNPWMSAFAEILLGVAPASPPAGTPGPFSLSDPDHIRSVLTRAGFIDIGLTPTSGPVTFGRDVAEAYDLLIGILGWMLQTRPPEERELATQALRRSLEEHAGSDGVQYASAIWLITARQVG